MHSILVSIAINVALCALEPSAIVAYGDRVQREKTATPLVKVADHDRVLRRWLTRHPDLRPARIDDCVDRTIDSTGKEHVASCARLVEDLKEWTKDPDANPFYAKGDFNGDGEQDFAVVLTNSKATKTNAPATIVVFNGPWRDSLMEPSFVLTGRKVSETLLGYGPPRPKPWQLVIGLPESEGRALVWRNGKYVMSD